MFATIIIYTRNSTRTKQARIQEAHQKSPEVLRQQNKPKVPLHKWFNLKESFYYHFKVFSFTIIHPSHGLVVEVTESTQPAFKDGSYHLTDVMVAV